MIVIQEWWGLTDHMADVTDRLAAEGFVALAPDLFGGRTTHDADEAGQLMQELPAEQAAQDLGGAVDYLLGLDSVTSSKVGVEVHALLAGKEVGSSVSTVPINPEEVTNVTLRIDTQ